MAGINSKCGTIYLMYKDEIVESRRYDGISRRNGCIEYWKMFYANKWNDMYLQISPEVSNEKINDDGTNFKRPKGPYKYKHKQRMKNYDNL